MKCCECQFGRWARALNGYTCKHDKGLGIIFKGSTSPHKCPLKESKYIQHGNSKGLYGIKVRGYHN